MVILVILVILVISGHIWSYLFIFKHIQRFITHSLAGGGSHNLGYHALRWEMILHGNAGELGTYAVLSVLPDKGHGVYSSGGDRDNSLRHATRIS